MPSSWTSDQTLKQTTIKGFLFFNVNKRKGKSRERSTSIHLYLSSWAHSKISGGHFRLQLLFKDLGSTINKKLSFPTIKTFNTFTNQSQTIFFFLSKYPQCITESTSIHGIFRLINVVYYYFSIYSFRPQMSTLLLS